MTQSYPNKIAIIEIYSHHVFVHTLASVARQCGMCVTIYTSPRLYKDMEPLFGEHIDDYRWEVSQDGENDFSFLKRIRPQIDREQEMLFINSVQGYRIGFFYLFRTKVKTVVGAGRISEFFGSKYKISGFNTLRKILHHNYTRFLMKRLVPRYEGIIVHTEQARRYALEHDYQKPMLQMPFSLYKGDVQHESHNKVSLKFVVTGSITPRSRDHMGLLKAFEKLWSKGHLEVKLTILSNASGANKQNVREYMQRLEKLGYPITYYSGWVPEQAFLDEAQEANFFISPLNLTYYSCGELTSGIVEAIRQAKPGIYPQGYLPDPNIASSSLFYQDFDDLISLVEELMQDPARVNQMSKNAIDNSQMYSLESVANQFKEQMQRWLS